MPDSAYLLHRLNESSIRLSLSELDLLVSLKEKNRIAFHSHGDMSQFSFERYIEKQPAFRVVEPIQETKLKKIILSDWEYNLLLECNLYTEERFLLHWALWKHLFSDGIEVIVWDGLQDSLQNPVKTLEGLHQKLRSWPPPKPLNRVLIFYKP